VKNISLYLNTLGCKRKNIIHKTGIIIIIIIINSNKVYIEALLTEVISLLNLTAK
jgi:hypothetical protein